MKRALRLVSSSRSSVSRRRVSLAVASLAALVTSIAIPGCGSDNGGAVSPGSCSNVQGQWRITGGCGPDVCDITQSGCSTTFSCGGGSRAATGSVSGSAVSWSGQTAGDVPGTCSGTVSGGAMSGTCNVSGAMCDFAATRVTGGGGDVDAGGGGGGGVDAGGGGGGGADAGGGGSDVDAGSVGGSCADYTGNWGVSGTCGADTCMIAQSGCTANFVCGSGSRSYTGTVSGDSVTWMGESGGGAAGTCTVTRAGSTFSGSCVLELGVTCTVTGVRL